MEGSKWRNEEHTEWHRVVMYGRQAETAIQYMKKGQMVYVEGRLNTREWEDQNQVKRKTTEIRCDNFTMLGRRGDNIINPIKIVIMKIQIRLKYIESSPMDDFTIFKQKKDI